MNAIEEKLIRQSGLNVHTVQSKKFKTINIVAKFRAPLSRETITNRAILPYILRQGTKSYPNEQALQLKLDQLYGAVLSIDGAKKGDNHIISFRLEVANENYISNESTVIDEAITLLHEVIFHPHIDEDAFNTKTFNREKETLKQKINAVIDDKMAYANMRLIDEMCSGEPYETHVHGYKDELEKMTAQNVYEYYKSMLQEDQLDIYIVGDFDEDLMVDKITSAIDKNENIQVINEQEIVNNPSPANEVIERQNIQQAKLHLGYRTNCVYKDNDYPALQVFNGIFGGFPSSKLFINVREKNSLAYYAASRLESHKGLLLVFSGIAASDYEQAREIIELQMNAMKNGDFTDDELAETKDLIENQLLETLDNPQGIVELLYQQVLGDKKMTPDQLIEKIRNVTKEDVIQVATRIQEDTIYLLTSEEEQTHE